MRIHRSHPGTIAKLLHRIENLGDLPEGPAMDQWIQGVLTAIKKVRGGAHGPFPAPTCLADHLRI